MARVEEVQDALRQLTDSFQKKLNEKDRAHVELMNGVDKQI
jgi:hypothetical protein